MNKLHSAFSFMKSKSVYDVLFAVWTGLAVLTVGGFLLFTNVVGGSADYAEAGRYFLSDHGVIKETSEFVYKICKAWEIAFWITFPAYVVGCFLLVWLDTRKKKSASKHEKGV